MLLKIAPFWIICLGIIGLLILVLHLIIRISGAKRRTIGLLQLHNDQRGGVQSLSFVLTLPVFIWIMMGVIQVSQIMLAQVVVEYAAIAAARSASVWTGEYVHSEDGTTEDRNCLGKTAFVFKSQLEGGSLYTIPMSDSGPTSDSGAENTVKISVVHRAAVLACIPIAPSRDTGYTLPSKHMGIHTALDNAFSALAGEKSAAPPEAISRRLRNKLAYSLANTFIEAEFFHPSTEIALQKYDAYYQVDPTYASSRVSAGEGVGDAGTDPGCTDPECATSFNYHPAYLSEAESFQANEMGWQDVITVHVRHKLALLPGPGRLLSRFVQGSSDERDKIAETIQTGTQSNEPVYTWPLLASATASIEGEKPILRYTQPVTLQ